MMNSRFAISILLSLTGCIARQDSVEPENKTERPRLPTGAHLDPAGRSLDVGSMPLAIAPSPDGKSIVILLNGWREQGVQVIDRGSGKVVQTLLQPAAFLGLVFSPDGKKLYASGGNEDAIYEYAWDNGRASFTDTIRLAAKEKGKSGKRYPAGIGLSPDGKLLYVAENLADSFAVVDLNARKVVRRFPTERYPYGVAVTKDGTVYVSAWNGWSVSVFRPNAQGGLTSDGRIPAGRHPSAMALSADDSRLFVVSGSTDRIAVIDTKARRAITTLEDPAPSGPHEGSTPNALALSADGRRLFVAEADNNAVAVFDLSRLTSGVSNGTESTDKLAGRIPVGWYPSGVSFAGDSLFVINGKGRGTGPNPKGPNPIARRDSIPPATRLVSCREH
jgi:YVTN family beta-propeller protein